MRKKIFIFLTISILLSSLTSLSFGKEDITKKEIDYTLSFVDEINIRIKEGETNYILKISKNNNDFVEKNENIEFGLSSNQEILDKINSKTLLMQINGQIANPKFTKRNDKLFISTNLDENYLIKKNEIYLEFVFIINEANYKIGTIFYIKQDDLPMVNIEGINLSYPFETNSIKLKGNITTKNTMMNTNSIYLKLEKSELISTDNLNLIETEGYYYIPLKETIFGKNISFISEIPIKKNIQSNKRDIKGSLVIYSNDTLSKAGEKYELDKFILRIDKPNIKLKILELIKNTLIKMKTEIAIFFNKPETKKTQIRLNKIKKNNPSDKIDVDLFSRINQNKNPKNSLMKIVINGEIVANSYSELSEFISKFNNEHRNILIIKSENKIEDLEKHIKNKKIELFQVKKLPVFDITEDIILVEQNITKETSQ